MEKKNNLFTLLIISAVVALGTTITYIVLGVTGFLSNNVGIDIVFAIVVPGVYFLVALCAFSYLSYNNAIKKLHQENIYYLGSDTGFFNYFLFSRRVKVLNRTVDKKGEAYILAATPMKLTTMRNNIKNDIVSDYLHRLADGIEDKFRISNKSIYKSLAYCYYHGIFLFFIVGGIDKVNVIAKSLEDLMYSIAFDNKLNVYVQPYFGIAKSARDLDSLLVDSENASLARQEAERLYKTLEYYSPEMNKRTNIDEIKELLQALNNKEFVVYYQPKFDLTTNKFVSSEALIRWNSSVHGLVSPAKFIELAENGGIIHQVDMFVFKQVCIDLRDNKKRGRRIMPVSVNFSMQEFYDIDFVDSLCAICDECGVSYEYLHIEVTERTSQVNSFMTVAICNKLKQKGFKVLMDDFGTGYSNLQNLLAIPFDAIKLDRSYVKNIDNDAKAYELVKFITSLCKGNNITLIAEGVDNKTQVELLRKIKCDQIQGFYYSRPLPKDEFDAFLLPNGNQFEKTKKGE